jgi:outer membrane biosynthesis protein TonB
MYAVPAVGALVTVLSLACSPRSRGSTAPVESGAPPVSYVAQCGGAAGDSTVWKETDLDSPITVERRPSFGREAGEGRADLRFVIDTRGLVELCNVEIIAASSPAFATAIEASLADAQYSVPIKDGRPVRARVEVRFRVEGRTIRVPSP